MLPTDTADRLTSFQLRNVAAGMDRKAGTPNTQPIRCHVTIPRILIRGGNNMNWATAVTNPALTKTCTHSEDEGKGQGDSHSRYYFRVYTRGFSPSLSQTDAEQASQGFPPTLLLEPGISTANERGAPQRRMG